MLTTYCQFRDLYLQATNAREPNGGWPARASYQNLARDGAYRANGTERSPRDRRSEQRQWTLIGASQADLDSAFAALLNEIGQFGRLVGLSASGIALWTDAELISARALNDPRPVIGRMRGVGVDVETEFLLPTPWWFAESQDVLRFSDLYDSTAGDLLLMGVVGLTPGSPVDMTWFVKGSAHATRMTITLTSGTGTVSKLAITNATTGYSLEWNGALMTGADLVLDTAPESILNDGTDAYDELTLGAHTRWMELAPGINAVTVEIDDTATDDSTVLSVAYYPAYP